MYRIYILCFFTFLVKVSFAQINNLVISTTIDKSQNLSYLVKPYQVLNKKFEIKNNFATDTSYFIDIGREEIAYLYEVNSRQLIAKNGTRVPILERSVRKDLRVLAIRLQPNETKKVELSIESFSSTEKTIHLKLLSYANYQILEADRSTSFYQKYWSPGYLGILLVILILAIIQYFMLPERVFIYYIFYLLFTIIRSAAFSETLVLEEWFPILNRIHYSTLHSQVFTYLSFIFYVLFLREFTGFAVKKPRLDFFYKIQIGYLIGFVVFDLAFPNEKFINPQLNAIFRILETIGLVLGLINLILLFKVYDEFNKFILWGAVSLFVIGIFGQEILKRSLDGSINPEQFLMYLATVWTIAYLVEILFFTIALINRQRLLMNSIRFEQDKNKTLVALLDSQKKAIEPETSTADYEYFSLATTKGVFVFQQAEIIRLEASGSYTIFSIHNQKQILASYSLSEFEQKLNPVRFIRVHKSHIVNLDYVMKYIRGDGGVLTLRDGSEIPVSRSRKEELLNKLPTVK